MERLYTCEEIAQRYSVKVPTVWRWIRNKQLPAINLNGSGYRVLESDLVAFEESKTCKKGVNTLSEKEKKILESITKAVPNMSEFDKGYFLGVGETIAKYKNTDKTDDSGKTQKESS